MLKSWFPSAFFIHLLHRLLLAQSDLFLSCLYLLVSLLNGCVWAAFDSTDLVWGFLFCATPVYMCAPVQSCAMGFFHHQRNPISWLPTLFWMSNFWMLFFILKAGGERQFTGKRKRLLASGFSSHLIVVLFISSSQLLGTLVVRWSKERVVASESGMSCSRTNFPSVPCRLRFVGKRALLSLPGLKLWKNVPPSFFIN